MEKGKDAMTVDLGGKDFAHSQTPKLTSLRPHLANGSTKQI